MRPDRIRDYIEKYGNDEHRLLRENPSLENLYAFSNQREGVIEWMDFRKDAEVLLIGDSVGALGRILLKKGCRVTFFCASPEEEEIIRIRYGENVSVCRELNSAGSYDAVICIGILCPKAEALLRENGCFILACDNKYGLKYLAGAQPNGTAYTKEEIERALPGARFYYPMNDYMIPEVIYSDAYLPKPGELSRYIAAYNDTEFPGFDIGSRWDEVCADGRFPAFADSFICIRGGEMPEDMPVYIKYNRTRKDEYKICTEIRQSADRRYVVKRALCEAGKEHIRGFEKRIRLLNAEETGVEYVNADISEDGMRAVFAYIDGEPYAEDKPCMEESCLTGGESGCEGEPHLPQIKTSLHNLDPIAGNYLVKDGTVYGIDAEWVSEEALDPAFVRYRILNDFYDRHAADSAAVPKEQFFRENGITPEMAALYAKKEHDFFEEIHGDTAAVYSENYRITTADAAALAAAKKNLEATKERIEGLKAQLRDKENEIKKMNEVKRLTDNHVANLEALIANLREEAGENGRMLTYLHDHEAFSSKVTRNIKKRFDAKFPAGSIGRLKVRHPVRFAKMKSTEDGRNILEGIEKIGPEYAEYGRLDFPEPEANIPDVSVIIPCYNQVGYTYRCLRSILENTGDVSYEVILADDVSTDATKEIEKFVTGVRVIHSPRNQGFLRNCNNAAKEARGRYLMFLNNDTEVKPGWLSSLYATLENDGSIGMTGSKLIFADGRLQEAGGIIWSDGSGWNYGRGDDPAKHEYNYVRDVDYISGAAILIRKELWEEIGGFDDRFAPAYCEDSDLAFEVRRHGKRVVYQPLSEVMHFEGISNGTDVNGSGMKKYQVENSGKLREKWAAEFRNQFENDGNPDPFRARERSGGRKIILVVDHYVPTFDRDAGSKTTYQYLKLFVEKGYVVKFLGDNFLHEEPYTTVLQQMGIEVLYGEHMRTEIWDWIDRHAKDLHLVYLNRPHITSKYIDYIKDRTGLRCIYYGHDLHFLRERRQFEVTGDVKSSEMSRYWKSVEFSIFGRADMSYYPSSVETEAILAEDSTVRVKPITAYVYDRFHEVAQKDFAERNGIIFVGGFAHPPNRDGLLWFLDRIWPEVYRRTKAPFFVVGSHADDEVKAACEAADGVIFKGFVSDEELMKLYDSCRIVAVPLRYGAGVKGKTVEALYYGCPVLTTGTGAEGIPEAGTVMRVADSEEEWKRLLPELYLDPETLGRMSAAASEYIRKHNSVEAAWKIIEKDFE